jgi:CRISPR-associated protein Csm3
LLEDIDTGLLFTEWKFENSIDRVTSAANPRNLERVPAGSEFEFQMIYDVEDLEQMKQDLKNLQFAMRLLEDDTLGGHGSRGYGHIKFNIRKIEARRLEFYRQAGNGVKSFNSLNEQELDHIAQFFGE